MNGFEVEQVVVPFDRKGIHRDELLLAESSKNYSNQLQTKPKVHQINTIMFLGDSLVEFAKIENIDLIKTTEWGLHHLAEDKEI